MLGWGREAAYQQLLDDISSGARGPGDDLDPDVLAEQFQMGRDAVVMALAKLGDDGLVEFDPGPHPRVTRPDLLQGTDSFTVLASLNALATELAVPHVTDADVAAMRAAHERMHEAIAGGRVDDAVEANAELHLVLVRAARSPELQRIIERLIQRVRRLDRLWFARCMGNEPPPYDSSHEGLIDACVDGDAGRAAQVAKRNFLLLADSLSPALQR